MSPLQFTKKQKTKTKDYINCNMSHKKACYETPMHNSFTAENIRVRGAKFKAFQFMLQPFVLTNCFTIFHPVQDPPTLWHPTQAIQKSIKTLTYASSLC